LFGRFLITFCNSSICIGYNRFSFGNLFSNQFSGRLVGFGSVKKIYPNKIAIEIRKEIKIEEKIKLQNKINTSIKTLKMLHVQDSKKFFQKIDPENIERVEINFILLDNSLFIPLTP